MRVREFRHPLLSVRPTLAVLCAAMVIACAPARKESQFDKATTGRFRDSSHSPAGDGRLLVSTASIHVVVAAVDTAAQRVPEIVSAADGYVVSSQVEAQEWASFSVRVRAANLGVVLDQLGALGKEESRETSSEDVTEDVSDLEADLANQRALRDRLRDLLKRAKDVKEILAVENELTRVQTEVERLEGRLRLMQTNVALSSISVRLTEEPDKRILGPLGYLYEGIKWGVINLFVIRPGEP